MKINSFLRENNLEITSFWLAEHKGKAPFSIPSDNKSKDRKANFPLL